MTLALAALERLQTIPDLTVQTGALLGNHTRFRLGGACQALVSTTSEAAYLAALGVLTGSEVTWTTIGGGTNLIVSDAGYPGLVLQYNAKTITVDDAGVRVDAGADLNDLVDFANAHGLAGMEAMAGIPGWVGAAIYGNAGAYGQSIAERIEWVRFADGAEVRQFGRAECEFRYRESIFKRNKGWQILSAGLRLEVGEAGVLQAKSASIRATRDAKFPPTMQCAGSIFKNLLLRELSPAVAAQVPANVIREGKIPAGWFLEEVGAKGLAVGAMRVADYHANLVYNTGGGTAADLVALLSELKRRVFDRFGLEIEEEVQFLS
ncbi:MAG: UDP-N-acetylmuramate dehydrogenase [Acidobacteria bacterium]|nr:UDP-N-acetylmuramate dehydrogenase [Acidobacteriota bacterium]